MPTSSQALILFRTDSGRSLPLHNRTPTPKITPFPVSKINLTASVNHKRTVFSKSEQFSTDLLESMSTNGFRGVLSFDPALKSFRWQLLPDPSEVKSTRPRFSKRYKSTPHLHKEFDLGEDLYYDNSRDEDFDSSNLRQVQSSKSNNFRPLAGHGCRTSSTIIEDFTDTITPWDYNALGQHKRLANALCRPGSGLLRITSAEPQSHPLRPPSAGPQCSERRPPSPRPQSPPGRSARPQSPSGRSGRPPWARPQSPSGRSPSPRGARPMSGRSPYSYVSSGRPSSARWMGETVKHQSAPNLDVRTSSRDGRSQGGLLDKTSSQKVAIPSVASRYQLSWKPGVSTVQKNVDFRAAGFGSAAPSLQGTFNHFTRSLSRSRRTRSFRPKYLADQNLTPSQEQLLYEEAKTLNKRKKVKLPSVRMRRVLPPLWPEALCFTTKNQGDYTHEDIKTIVECQAHSPVGTVQFDPVYVHLGPENTNDMCIWVFSINDSSKRTKLMETGILFEGGKVRVRRYDDVLNEEYQAYRLFNDVQEDQRQRKIIPTSRRRATGFKSVALICKNKKHIAFTGCL